MSNFTWADIYAPHARAVGGEAPRLIAELRAAYRQATALFRIQPALRMDWLKPAIDVGMVANQGRNRRDELVRHLGLTRRERLVYLYIGRYGQSDMDWSRLDRCAGAESISSATIPCRTDSRTTCTSSRRPTGPAAI